MHVYRCPVCGYLHVGVPDFHFCPVCSTPVEVFTRETGSAHFANWTTNTRLMIMAMAETGRSQYDGKGTTRSFLNTDDLLFLPAQISRFPLLSDEDVASEVVLGKQAEQPIIAKIPVLNAGMSFGALSREAKMALAKASAIVGGIANTGEGGMLNEERELADKLTLQFSTGRFGASEDRLKIADIIEVKISQGAKPAMGGLLPGEKVTQEIADIRQIPVGKAAKSPARHKDIDSPKALAEKIAWLRRITGGKPISLKFVGGHIQQDLDAIFSQEHIPDILV